MKHSKDFKVQPIVDIKTNRVCGGELLDQMEESYPRDTGRSR